MIVRESIYEAIKHLKPRSEEELKFAFKDMSPRDKLITGAKEGLIWLVQNALDAGADVHTDNDTALRIASYNGYTEIVKLLLDAGANPFANSVLTHDAFYWAGQSSYPEKHEILELLKQYKKEK